MSIQEIGKPGFRFKTGFERPPATVVERYDLRRVCLPQHLALIDRVTAGRPLSRIIRPRLSLPNPMSVP